MRRATMIEPGKIVFSEVERPTCFDGQVLLRIKTIGICGSDLHVYKGKHPYTKYPVIQGHEFAAEVVEVNATGTGFVPGQLVTAIPSIFCGKCHPCRHGRYNICRDLRVMGFQADGVAQDFVAMPVEKIIPLPDTFSLTQAALIEPIAVAVHAVHRTDVEGKQVLILGGGPIGNLVAQVCLGFGADTVMITDISDFRLEIAHQCGIKNCVNPRDVDLNAEIMKVFGPDGPDTIFECVGVKETMDDAINSARKGTRIVIVGVFSEKVQTDLGLVQDRELELVGTLMYCQEDYFEAVSLMQKGHIKHTPLVSRIFPFEAYDEAYSFIINQKDQVMKVMVSLD